MTAPDLKPCPFCGGDKNMICKTDYDGGYAYAVSCRYPECHGCIFTLGYGFFSAEAEAIAAWNTRAVDPAADRIEQLKEELKSQIEHTDDLIRSAEPMMALALGAAENAAEVAEAKLAKAVKALRFTDDGANHAAVTPTYSEHGLRYILRGIRERARAVLAELEKTE